MAARRFRRKASASTPEARFEASRIQDARRRGYTNREIGTAFGINERTVRKIVAGETSGKRIYREHVAPTRDVPPEARNLSIVRLDLVIGKDEHGNDVVRTVNARTPLINGRTPTPFDVFRMPDLASVIAAETARMREVYQGSVTVASTEGAGRLRSIRPIIRRDPSKRLVTIRGLFA